ncbi:MAG: hypothetical protein AABX05_03105 [Nanoarchaeota archaeon]
MAKLENVSPIMHEATKTWLEREQLYPISEEQAKDLAKRPLSEKVKMLYAFTLIGAVNYADQKNEEQEGSWFDLIYGGLRALPSAFKEAIKGVDPQELMENHNNYAKQYFKSAKRNFDYYFLNS